MYRLTLDAVDDLTLLTNYIATRNPSGALSVLNALTKKFEYLGMSPRAGDKRPDMGADVRVVPSGSYVIYFRPEGRGVMILRVIHGARDFRALDEE